LVVASTIEGLWWEIPHERKAMPGTARKEYTVRLDSKKRFVVRGAKSEFYLVRELGNGHVLLSPQKLMADHPPISEKLVRQIGRSVRAMKEGFVSGRIDLKAARRLLQE
jgi:hypothetical protein